MLKAVVDWKPDIKAVSVMDSDSSDRSLIADLTRIPERYAGNVVCIYSLNNLEK